MVKLSALRVLAFDTGSTFGLFTDKTFMFITLFINIFNPSHIDDAIFFLKVTFRYPDRTNIMNPNIVTIWLVCGVGRLVKVVVVKLLSFLLIGIFACNLLRRYILLLLLVVWTFL